MGRQSSRAPEPAEGDTPPSSPRGRRRHGDRETIVSEGGLTLRVTHSDLPGPDESAPTAREEPPRTRPHPVAPEVYDIDLDDGRIDDDAARVVRRLTRAGWEAYLVGGCVRDLLLGHDPKDFDVATSARPDDVRRLFRNSRIIGRRFRLVHVLFGGGKVIETATFRKAPEGGSGTRATDVDRSDDLLIRNDNVFGEAHEDALRRDFTINGLFYDLDRRRVLDWVGGVPDVRARTVRTIGDPVTRFLEDPVRMLRAIKFCARLDLGIQPEVYDAIVACRGSLAMAAKPRLFEELLRLLRGGAAHRSIWLCWETGVLDVLLPELSAWLADSDDPAFWHLLQAVDRTASTRGAPPDDVVLWCALLFGPTQEACDGAPDRLAAAQDLLEPIVDRLNVPRRIADAVRRVVAIHPRFQAGKAPRFGRSPMARYAQELAELLHLAAGANDRAGVESAERAVAGDPEPEPGGGAETSAPRRKRRRRSRARTARGDT